MRAAREEGLVGPNAILQVEHALRAAGGATLAEEVFETAGLIGLLRCPPDAMVAEDAAARLHRAVATNLPATRAESLAKEAGRRTADYILEHRIPRTMQLILRALPRPLAARLLLAAIAGHGWTFAGSGRVVAKPGRPAIIHIDRNPLATPGCPWHGAVFERLFRTLVAPETTVREVSCCAHGAPSCRFEVSFGRRGGAVLAGDKPGPDQAERSVA